MLGAGSERVEVTVNLAVQPTTLKEAARRYFPDLGITLRESVIFDRISRRMVDSAETGVIANFVRPNSPANTAGLRAGDLIQEAVTAMEFGGSAEDLARTCHGHPGLSEAVKEAALAVDGRAIHI